MNCRFILKCFQQAHSSLYPTNKLLKNTKKFGYRFHFLKMMRYCSTLKCYEDKDPGPLFFNEEVQSILKKLTGFDINKIFKDRHLENPDSNEEQILATKEILEEKNKIAMETSKLFLQMPPVLQERKPIKEILSFDPAIQGLETGNIIFTDISFGVSDRDRLIVVREPNGVLRKAFWEERDAMNLIYNPRPSCFYKTPPAFQDEYFQDVLRREEYLFILDFACSHFEPDDPKFQEVTRETYEHVKKKRKFEVLHSTRHFGPMAFYFAWNRNIDDLLMYLIEDERIEDAIDLIRLYYIINDKTKLTDIDKEENPITIIKNFINEAAMSKGSLELVVQNYEENKRQKEEYEKKLKDAHGIS